MACAQDTVRGVWWDQRCPTNTDALQVATEALLDAADTMASSGLVEAGFSLLAMPACRLLQHPSHREAIARYFAERGMSLLFAAAVIDDPGASSSSDFVMIGADRSLRLDTRRRRGALSDAQARGGGLPAEAPGSCAQLYLQRLASLSGLGGWNDPRTHLPPRLNRTHMASSALPFGPPLEVHPSEFRSHFALACIRGAPLVLSVPPHRMQGDMLNIVTDPLALAVQTANGGVRPERIDVPARAHGSRFAVHVRLEGWVRRSTDGVSAVLLLINHDERPATAEIPWHALRTRPLAQASIFDEGGTSDLQAGAWARFAFSRRRRPQHELSHATVPPGDCVLLVVGHDDATSQVAGTDGASHPERLAPARKPRLADARDGQGGRAVRAPQRSHAQLVACAAAVALLLVILVATGRRASSTRQRRSTPRVKRRREQQRFGPDVDPDLLDYPALLCDAAGTMASRKGYSFASSSSLRTSCPDRVGGLQGLQSPPSERGTASHNTSLLI